MGEQVRNWRTDLDDNDVGTAPISLEELVQKLDQNQPLGDLPSG